jgi:transposase-like protein
MPYHYAPEFRRDVCERLLADESVAALAEELSVSMQTLYRWRRQALVDVGRLRGPKSFEVDPLAQARRKIKDLEKELKLLRAASALFDEEEPPSAKGSSRLFEG